MLLQRTLVILLLLPVGLALIFLGGAAYVALWVLVLGLASYEYVRMFRVGGLEPAGFLVVAGTSAFVIGRALDGFQSTPLIISLIVLLSMTYHLFAFERGRSQAGTDFGVTLGGAFYLGWLGAFLISIRFLPEGQWWTLIVLPAVWFCDSGAYLIGSLMGRHALSQRLSPHKTWEGYIGGILVSVPMTALLAIIWSIWTGPNSAITPIRAGILGFVLSVFTILGDLGASMIKRQVGVKDSGKLLPGHGGAFDRIDTWLWAGVIGYFIISHFFLA